MAGCDVAVVGAGVIGQAIAYELVTRGTAVTILDARGAGLGSTQAAAGMLGKSAKKKTVRKNNRIARVGSCTNGEHR